MIDRVCALVRFHMQVLFAAKGLPFGDACGDEGPCRHPRVALLGLCDRMGLAPCQTWRKRQRTSGRFCA